MSAAKPKTPPPLPIAAHKGDAGRMLCIAGSETMPGAAVLILRAALQAGIGLVQLAVFDKNLIHAVCPAVPEAVYLDLSRSKDLIAGRLPTQIEGRKDHVRVVGPGLGQGGRTDELVRRLVTTSFSGPLVLDADGLNVIGDMPEVLAGFAGQMVLTPHPGEAARLMGVAAIATSDEGRIECAKAIAHAAGGLCILKGYHTVVTDGEQVFVSQTGNPGMASAGSGDTLCGILGAYLASVVLFGSADWTFFDAACSAVHTHGLAGDLAAAKLGQRALTASAIISHLAEAQQQLAHEPGR
ncbi:MAG: NAD(P)H-hydrate dehydratase [bacterium]